MSMSSKAWRQVGSGYPRQLGWYWCRYCPPNQPDPEYEIIEVLDNSCVSMGGSVMRIEDAVKMFAITHLVGPLSIPPDPLTPQAAAEANVTLM